MQSLLTKCGDPFSPVRLGKVAKKIVRGLYRRGCSLYRWWEEHEKVRSLIKNQRKMWYALYGNKVPILDENGDYTGEDDIKYYPPVEFKANLSAGKGSAEKEVFGVDVDFTRSISTTDMTLPITETSLIWYETKPVILEDGTPDPNSADYEVAAHPADGLNELVIALKARVKNAKN